MTVLKQYNAGTSAWEPIVSGVQGPTGPTGATGPTGPAVTNGGLVYISTTSFTTQSTIQLTSAFTSTYKNYLAVFSFTCSTASATYMRWLVGTTAQTGDCLSMAFGAAYSTNSYTGSTRGDLYMPLPAGYPTYPTTYTMNIFNPQGTGYSAWSINPTVFGISGSDSALTIANSRNVATTQMDGFEFTTATGAITITGSITLYGYKN
jgi:hypothetical protein